jgi:hypothetical protein
MKCELTFVVLLAFTVGCFREDSERSIAKGADSKLVSRHEGLEKLISDYYLSIEESVKMDLGVSEAEIVQRVQGMINDGYVQKPVILVITEDGPRWQTVDYPTYKNYMESNAIALRSYHGTQPNILDTVSMDSIRSNLLQALKVDSVNNNFDDKLFP